MMELIEKAEKEGIELPPAATDNVSQEQIQSMLAETMKQIETRKKKVQEAVRNKLFCNFNFIPTLTFRKHNIKHSMSLYISNTLLFHIFLISYH